METRFWKPKNTGDELAARIDALTAQIKLDMMTLEQRFNNTVATIDRDMELIEQQLLARIAELEKSARQSSLPAEGEKKSVEELAAIPGYKTWSQRKAERVAASGSKDFMQKTLRRSQRPKPEAPATT